MKKVIIYADGSSLGNPGPGGWCAILSYQNVKKEIYGSKPYTTNNEMELTAVIRALETLKEPCEVELYTDSNYVVKGLESWLDSWAKNEWKNSSKKEIANKELWQKLYMLKSKHRIHPHWIKGHNGDPMNERCDKVAKQQAKRYKDEKGEE